jgi:crotonobetainyl-CoA:carnitine CoA-transferase CaiB-like acyl-CoA transferase
MKNGEGPTCRAALEGLRVLEIGHFVAAPFCTRLLGDLGAEVTKIEPLTGDPVRTWGERLDGRSLWWSIHGRNKKSIAMNIRAPGAKDVILRLVQTCDVLVENFRPGQLDKYGLDEATLRAARPDLVIARISGYGQTGPYRDKAAFGVIGEAIGGLRYLTNHPPGTFNLPPVRVGVSIGDSIAGLYAAFGIMAALWQRDRKDGGDGVSRTIDVALTESVFSMMEAMLPEYDRLGRIKQPTGGGIATAAPSNAYASADAGFMLIAANSEPLFARLTELIGRPELLADPRFADNPSRCRNVEILDEIIRDWSKQFTLAELEQLLSTADIPSSKVYTAADIATDVQYRARGMVREVEDSKLGPLLHPGIVPHIVEGPGQVRWTGPDVGEHTDMVLSSAGFFPEEIEKLRKNGIVA